MLIKYLPSNLFLSINISLTIIGLIFIFNSIGVYKEKNKEKKFLHDFRDRILKLQEANMINLKNKI